MKGHGKTVIALFAVVIAASIFHSSSAFASKQVIDFFGGNGAEGGKFTSEPSGIAVNQTGAGPADAGDLYVTEPGSNRIQRFGRDDNGTPANPADDTHFFISAWGADVDSTPAGGSDYEICTVAADCQKAVASGGNDTQTGNGSLNSPSSVAVDQDSGDVYISDAANSRVSVYTGSGAFLRSFGYDVVASGPGKVPAPSEKQQLTVKASGGRFSLSFAGETTGAIGHGVSVRQGSNVVNGVDTFSGAFAVGQAFQAIHGFQSIPLFPAGTTIAAVGPGVLTLSKAASLSDFSAAGSELFADSLTFNVSAGELQDALNGLPSIGGVGGSVTVTGGPGDEAGTAPYTIEFGGSLGDDDVPMLVARDENLTINSGTASATVDQTVKGGAYEVCDDAVDVCKAGSPGPSTGQIGNFSPPQTFGIAVSPSDGDPDTGSVFVADGDNRRIDTFRTDGSSPGSIGSAATFAVHQPEQIALDSRSVVYASNGDFFSTQVERYDSQDANGVGVGFLSPIVRGVDEVQKISVSAGSGSYRLSFDPDGGGPQGPETTGDIPFDWPSRDFGASDGVINSVNDALAALPSIRDGAPVFGGPGDVGGSSPYTVEFKSGLGARDVPELTVSAGTTPLAGGSGASVTTTTQGHGTLTGECSPALAVDPDSDGAGPDTDILYVRCRGLIQQFGPLSSPGLTAPPVVDDDRHATGPTLNSVGAVDLDQQTGSLLATARGLSFPDFSGSGIYVINNVNPSPPTVTLDSLTNPTSHGLTAHATINPNGSPDTSYHFEYSVDGIAWKSTPTVVLGSQEAPQAIEELIDPPGTGLEPNTLYHVRLAAQRRFTAPIMTPELTLSTLPDAPGVETVGTPLRTTTTALLAGRVNPRGTTTSFHFEYGDQGPCSANTCASTPDISAGAGLLIRLVSSRISNLAPSTTYHYRLVADNGNPGSPSFGGDMTVTTRASDAPLSHGHFPGPAGSDRAWEQVSTPDSGGNPVFGGYGFSADGDRAVYQIAGGTPLSESGGVFNMYFAQRPAGRHPTSGWQTQAIFPSRDELVGPSWFGPAASQDLSSIFVRNFGGGASTTSLFRLTPGAAAITLRNLPFEDFIVFAVSADGSRVVATLRNAPDPEQPLASGAKLYDLTSGVPKLISFLPEGAIPSCEVSIPSSSGFTGQSQVPMSASGVVSADGSLAFFSCGGRIYARDIEAAETARVSPEDCNARFLKSTPDSVFYWCSTEGGNIYRYDLSDETRDCVTCVVPDLDADVHIEANPSSGLDAVAIAEDGSRVYFRSPNILIPGAAPNGIYRVKTASGDLAYVGNIGPAQVGELAQLGEAITPDGSKIVFGSEASTLNPLGGGQTNGGTYQYYGYDDTDRSLTCLSCPENGAPMESTAQPLLGVTSIGQTAPGATPLADDGTFAFVTNTPLVGLDQNTPGLGQNPEVGADVYEWRDGRFLLVSDGLNNWPVGSSPKLSGISPSGRDIYFTASAQYTPDALDSYYRLYDARIGGGIDFPQPPPPCPLEVCQGTPKGAPEEAVPGTTSYAGVGNRGTARATRSCPQGKRKVRRAGKSRCVSRKRQHKSRANHNRRAAR